ncbi:MAG: hypothetical protein LBQ64_06580 [Bacteroidales bacterium]|jgi:hypothetical protein|nr:hypothetical protein [Bacteroidales bacterium]
MEKRDITGKKQYKELSIRPVRHNTDHHAFILVKTAWATLDFFAEIYRQTDYLFGLSAQVFTTSVDSRSFAFRVFEYQDVLSEHIAFCIVNRDLDNKQFLLGSDEKNACFVFQKKKRTNQLLIDFDKDDENPDQTDVLDTREESNWTKFKTTMLKNTVTLTGNTDFVFPVDIRTYDILRPLFLKIKDMHTLDYMFIPAKSVLNVDLFMSRSATFHDELNRSAPLFLSSSLSEL